MVKLRTYVYIDSLQPQLAEYIASVSQGFHPVPGNSCLWIEVSPGMAFHRYTDIALKATRVNLAQQVVERAQHAEEQRMLRHQTDVAGTKGVDRARTAPGDIVEAHTTDQDATLLDRQQAGQKGQEGGFAAA